MTSSSRTFHAVAGDRLEFAQIIDALSAKFVVVIGKRQAVRRARLDTFDRRLHGAGLALEHRGTASGDRLVFSRLNGDLIVATPVKSLQWPALADALPTGPVRTAIAPIIDIRALTIISSERRNVRVLDLRNSDTKTVVRVEFDEPATVERDPTATASRVTVHTLHGTACEVIAHGKVVDVDLGSVGERHFLNVASLGLSVAVTQGLTPRLKKRLGPAAYPVALLRTYRSHVPFRAWLDFPDADHPALEFDDLLQVTVGNGRYYGGGNAVSPTAGIDDHLLDVYAIRTGRLRDYAGIVRALRDGSFVEHFNVVHVTTRRVTVRTEPRQKINADGEVVAATPQMLSVHNNALDVLVPHYSTAAQYDATASSDTKAQSAER